jgi:hypothetical protein
MRVASDYLVLIVLNFVDGTSTTSKFIKEEFCIRECLKVLAIGNRTTLDDNLVSSVFHAYIISNKNNSAKILSEIYF